MKVRPNIYPALVFLIVFSASSFGQVSTETPTFFRVGERLSYNVSFEKFNNVAFFETFVVSRGKFGGREAVELQSRIKTFDFVSAAFSLIDETRSVFAAPETGLPIFITRSIRSGAIPKESNLNFLDSPTSNYDLLTLVFKAREAGGTGTFTFSENGESYVATFASVAGEKVRTDAGDFETTTAATVQSTYLDGFGIKELRINFSDDEYKIPVLIRFRTAKGQFVATLSGLTVDEIKKPTDPIPSPSQTPFPTSTPKPQPTPQAYVDNQPLLKELEFALGEKLEYKITSAGQPVANVVLLAKERKQSQNGESLLLTATVTDTDQRNRTFANGDSMVARVNPDTLAPQAFEMKFSGQLASINQSISVDSRTGVITFGANTVDAPIGTHCLLSLIYGLRSFNLKPSKDLSNPVNDTRVAVFWNARPYVFVLRPSNPDTITLDGEKVGAQMISINTSNPQLDALSIKVWLSTDDRRVPLRFTAGTFQADLVSESNIFNQ